MIIAILGALCLAIGISVFLMFPRDNISLKPAAIIILVALGLSLADPIIIMPIGKFIVNLPWFGGV